MIHTLPPSTLDDLVELLQNAGKSDYDAANYEGECAEFIEALLDVDHPSHRRVFLELREYVTR